MWILGIKLQSYLNNTQLADATYAHTLVVESTHGPCIHEYFNDQNMTYSTYYRRPP